MVAAARAKRGTIGGDGLLRFFIAVALVVVFPWLVITSSPDGGRNAMWIPCLLIAAWSGLRLAGLIARGVPRLFELSFWLFCYLFMGIGAAAQIHADDMAGTTPRLDPARDAAAVVVVVIGIVAFEVGKLAWRSRPHPDPELPTAVPDPVAAAEVSSTRSLWLLAGVAPIAVLFIAYLGPATFFRSRDEFGDAAEELFGESPFMPLLLALAWVPALVVIHRVVARRRSRPGSKLTGPELIGIAVSVGLILFANNGVSSSRYAFGSMVLSLAVLFGAFSTTSRARRSMLMVIVGFVVVFPLADLFRREETEQVQVSVVDEYSGNPDYDAFGQISNAVTVVGDEGFSYAQQPLGVALFWVPRSLWEDKPNDTGVYLARERGYTVENLSAPLWAELYVIGGHLVVAAGFVVLGALVVRADDRLVQSLRGVRPYSVVGAFMPFYLIILLRGSLLQATALAATLAVSVWITRPAVRHVRRRRGVHVRGPGRAWPTGVATG